jgi:hypothetical protein
MAKWFGAKSVFFQTSRFCVNNITCLSRKAQKESIYLTEISAFLTQGNSPCIKPRGLYGDMRRKKRVVCDITGTVSL